MGMRVLKKRCNGEVYSLAHHARLMVVDGSAMLAHPKTLWLSGNLEASNVRQPHSDGVQVFVVLLRAGCLATLQDM